LEPAVLSDRLLLAIYKGQGGVERGFRGSLRFALSVIHLHGLETPAPYGAQFHYGPLAFNRGSVAFPSRRDPADYPRSSPQAKGTFHDAALVLQFIEVVELLHILKTTTSRVLVLCLLPLHRLILHMLGPLDEKIFLLSG
jgi:hypothetical protein